MWRWLGWRPWCSSRGCGTWPRLLLLHQLRIPRNWIRLATDMWQVTHIEHRRITNEPSFPCWRLCAVCTKHHAQDVTYVTSLCPPVRSGWVFWATLLKRTPGLQKTGLSVTCGRARISTQNCLLTESLKYSFSHSCTKHLLSTYCVQTSLLDTGLHRQRRKQASILLLGSRMTIIDDHKFGGFPEIECSRRSGVRELDSEVSPPILQPHATAQGWVALITL